jgi:hypothetical protein
VKNDIIQIDNLCKSFTNSFYKSLQKNEDKKYIKNEEALYSIVFTLVMIDACLKEEVGNINNNPLPLPLPSLSVSLPLDKNNIYKKYFCDMMIILKNLNEGGNYDVDFIKNCFKFSKLMGYVNLSESGKSNTTSTSTDIINQQFMLKKQVWIYIENKYKQYK